MEPYGTPHNTVPFDKIEFDDFEPAFMEGIRRDDEETEKIINNPEPPTFENTIAVVDESKGEHYYDLLDRVSTVFSCLMSANTSPRMEALAQKAQSYPHQARERHHPQPETLCTCQGRTRPSP